MREKLTDVCEQQRRRLKPAYLLSLISAFVISILENITTLLRTPKISRFWVVSVAKQTGLSLTWSGTQKLQGP